MNSNAINTVTKTLTSSQGAKVTHTQLVSETEKVSLKDVEIMGLISDSTNSIKLNNNAEIEITKQEAIRKQALESFNKSALGLHSGGVRLLDGRSKDKQTSVIRTHFLDELSKAMKVSSAQKYYELFMSVVNSGKPVKSFNTGLNVKLDDSKTSKKKKGADTSKQIDIIELLADVYNNPKFEKTLSESTQLEIFEILNSNKYFE
jgi:hypothetical protein